MSYIKFKELTNSFNFFKELKKSELPKYVLDYLDKGEDIWASYATFRDKCIFTDKKILLFDQRGIFGKTKKIHFFPYCNISSSAIEYRTSKVILHFSMDSGYQLKLSFIKLSGDDKTKLRVLYSNMLERIDE